MAMYLAKAEGKNDFRFFSSDIRLRSIERLMLEAGTALLRPAIESPALQPEATPHDANQRKPLVA